MKPLYLISRLYRFTAFLLCLISVYACGNVTVRSAHPFDISDKKLDPGSRGYIMARVLNNTGEFEFNRWDHMVVTSANSAGDQKKVLYYVPAVHGGESSTRLFFGVLPAGDYAITMLREYIPQLDLIRTAPAPATLGTFSIVPGRVTDLSAMLYQPLASSTKDQKFTITRDQDTLDLFPQIESNFPELTQHISKDRVFGWRTASIDNSQAANDALRGISLRYPSLNGTLKSIDQNAVALSSVGVLLERDANAEWTIHDTGFRVNLNDLVRLANGSYLISAEFGLLLHSKSLSGPWQQLTSPATASNLTALIPDTQGGIYLIARRGTEEEGIPFLEYPILRHNQYNIYYSSDPVAGAWSELKLPIDFDEPSNMSYDQHFLYFNVSGRDILRYNFDTKTWDQQDIPYHQFYALPDGGQISYSSNYTLEHSLVLVRDQADSRWTRVSKLFMDGLPFRAPDGRWFVNARVVPSLAEGNRIDIRHRKHRLVYIDPQSKKPVEYGPSLNECPATYLLPDPVLFNWHQDELWAYCLTSGGFYHFDRTKREWGLETTGQKETDTPSSI